MNRVSISWLAVAMAIGLAGCIQVDRSQSVFFTPDVSVKIQNFKNLTLSRWNFVRFEQPEIDRETICERLSALANKESVFIPCSVDSFRPQLLEWIHHLPLREAFPTESQWKERLAQTLSKASLPSGLGGGDLTDLLRFDPLGSAWDLLKIKNSTNPTLHLKDPNGLIFPILLPFAADQTNQTLSLQRKIQEICPLSTCGRFSGLGPHFSTLENESQIMRDLQRVTLSSAALLLLSLTLLVWFKRLALLWNLIPVACGVMIAFLLTHLLDGSVHGLTLSFGIGIVGLGLDYGFHSSFHRGSLATWKQNLTGLLTTLVLFFLLLKSEIPLLRQMAFFSIVGLTAAFFLTYIQHRLFPHRISLPAYTFVSRSLPSPILQILKFLPIVLALGWLLLPKLHFDFSLEAFDYRSVQTQSFRDLFDSITGRKHPIVTPLALEPGIWKESENHLQFGTDNSLQVDSLARYLPDEETQRKNLATWPCTTGKLIRAPDTSTGSFFHPFYRDFSCPSVVRVRTTTPMYLNHLMTQQSAQSLWYPQTDEEAQKIFEAFPKSFRLSELTESLTANLRATFATLLIMSLIAIATILFLNERSVLNVAFSLLPFLAGSGLVFLMGFLFEVPLSFVSLIGLLILLGLSVDYGIFASRSQSAEVQSSLLTAGLTTLIGFAPLVICSHPVLHQLGHTLTVGTLGTLLTAYSPLFRLHRHSS